MENFFISKLRDRKTTTEEFKAISNLLAESLAYNSLSSLKEKKISITTPIAICEGTAFEQEPILIVILRSGIAMLSAFQKVYPKAKVGILGIYRDDKDYKPQLYYKKIPKLSKKAPVFILDPMVATGNTLIKTIKILIEEGSDQNMISSFSFIAAKEGLDNVQKQYPSVRLNVKQIDPSLNSKKFISPGLGDFGDRYFGTEC